MPRVTPEVADLLLDRLSSDDRFRGLFEKDPNMALAMLGHPVPNSFALKCAPLRQLASKQEFAAARAQLRDQIISAAALTNPHCFEAGNGTPAVCVK